MKIILRFKLSLFLFFIFYFLFFDICSTFSQNQAPEVNVQIGHKGIIEQVKFSPDGSLVLSSSRDKTVKLWEAATGKLVRTYEGHAGNVNSICFSPDGNSFYSGGEDKLVICWELSTGNILKKFEGCEDEISSVSISPDGKTLASYARSEIKLWDASSGELINTITGLSGSYSTLDFSPDSKFIISSANNELKMWNVSSGTLEKDFEDNPYGYFSPVFSPDGKSILTGSSDRIIRLFDVSSGKITRTFEGHEARVTAVAFSPDGKYIISGSDDKTVVLRDINNSQVISSFNSHKEEIWSLSFSPDGDYIISASTNEIMLSESATGRYVRSFEGNTSAISSAVFTPDGKFILTGCYDNTLKLWEASSFKLIRTFEGHTELVRSVAVSPDGKYALSGAADNKVKLWDISTAKLLKTFEGHNEIVNSVAFSPDGNYAVSGSWDQKVKLWSVPSGKLVNTIKLDIDEEISIAFSPDGKYLLIGGIYSNNIILWDISKDKLYKTFNYLDAMTSVGIKVVAFSPDGKKILSGSCDATLALWDIETGNIIKYFKGHRNCITSAVFTTDGKNILSGGEDNTMKLWDVATGQTLKTFEGHSDRITSVCLSPDNKFAVSSSADNKMILWDLKSGNEIVDIFTYLKKDYVVMTPDNYYLCSKNGVKVLAFVIGNHAFPPEQFDLQYNRPDVVLKRIGLADEELIEAYHKAYLKRLKKLNFNENMFKKDFQLPEMKLLTKKIPLSTENKNLSFKITAKDSKYLLDRINVYVNDVALYGTDGIDLRDKQISTYDSDINLELSEGKNKIQMSVLNEKGVESLKETVEIKCEMQKKKHDLYVVTIGASEYNDSRYKLRYAAKDANDIAELMMLKKDKYNEVKVTKLLDKDVTKENIQNVKEFLMKSKVDDEVIIFIAGHGLLTKDFDYYFATSDIDFNNPQLKGITFEEIESLLDGIPARQKVLLMDTCHSGELDKEDLQIIAANEKTQETGEPVFAREIPGTNVGRKNETEGFGLKNVSDLMQEMFVDLRRGSGAAVISSSGGLEVSYEGGDFKNGFFTYAILEGIKTMNADLNKDGIITVSELRDYVGDKVEKLTKGAQKPTSRKENLENDFVIW